jgi:hypothetical protein
VVGGRERIKVSWTLVDVILVKLTATVELWVCAWPGRLSFLLDSQWWGPEAEIALKELHDCNERDAPRSSAVKKVYDNRVNSRALEGTATAFEEISGGSITFINDSPLPTLSSTVYFCCILRLR